jgi:hypothetical protein
MIFKIIVCVLVLYLRYKTVNTRRESIIFISRYLAKGFYEFEIKIIMSSWSIMWDGTITPEGRVTLSNQNEAWRISDEAKHEPVSPEFSGYLWDWGSFCWKYLTIWWLFMHFSDLNNSISGLMKNKYDIQNYCMCFSFIS